MRVVESFPVIQHLMNIVNKYQSSSTVNIVRCTGAYVVIHLSTVTVRSLMEHDHYMREVGS